MKLFFFLLLSFTISYSSAGQDLRNQFALGKEQLRLGNYSRAISLFETVEKASETNPYRSYAQFYKGISALRQGNAEQARSILVDLERAQPGWERRDELLFWIAQAEFALEKFPLAIEALTKIRNPAVRQDGDLMQKAVFAGISSQARIEELYRSFPDNRELARRMVQLLATSNDAADRSRSALLVERFGLENEISVRATVEPVKKDVYHIGLLLPQTLHLVTAGGQVRNTIYLDFISGFRLGIEALKKRGVNLEVFAYDTRSTAYPNQEALLNLKEVKGMDVLVYHQNDEGLRVAMELGQETGQKILAPLAASSSDLMDNVLLAKPSNETLARIASRHALELTESRNAVIIYGNGDRDRNLAESYRKEMEALGFTIRFMEMVTGPESTTIFDRLIATKPEPIPGSEDENATIEVPVIPRDELGHVMVASETPAIIASTVSALTRRADKVPLIGLDTWLANGWISPSQAETLGVSLLGFYAMNAAAEESDLFREEYISRFANFPAPYAYFGYDAAMVLGDALDIFGLDFISGILAESERSFRHLSTYRFLNSQDNQFVPIYRVVDGKLTPLSN